jgi:hypothetical protein
VKKTTKSKTAKTPPSQMASGFSQICTPSVDNLLDNLFIRLKKPVPARFFRLCTKSHQILFSLFFNKLDWCFILQKNTVFFLGRT